MIDQRSPSADWLEELVAGPSDVKLVLIQNIWLSRGGLDARYSYLQYLRDGLDVWDEIEYIEPQANNELAHQLAHHQLKQSGFGDRPVICGGWLRDDGQRQSCDGQTTQPLGYRLEFSLERLDYSPQKSQSSNFCWRGVISSSSPQEWADIPAKTQLEKLVYVRRNISQAGLLEAKTAHDQAHRYLDELGITPISCPGYLNSDGRIQPCDPQAASYPLQAHLVTQTAGSPEQCLIWLNGLNAPAGLNLNIPLYMGNLGRNNAYQEAWKVLESFCDLQISQEMTN